MTILSTLQAWTWQLKSWKSNWWLNDVNTCMYENVETHISFFRIIYKAQNVGVSHTLPRGYKKHHKTILRMFFLCFQALKYCFFWIRMFLFIFCRLAMHEKEHMVLRGEEVLGRGQKGGINIFQRDKCWLICTCILVSTISFERFTNSGHDCFRKKGFLKNTQV